MSSKAWTVWQARTRGAWGADSHGSPVPSNAPQEQGQLGTVQLCCRTPIFLGLTVGGTRAYPKWGQRGKGQQWGSSRTNVAPVDPAH